MPITQRSIAVLQLVGLMLPVTILTIRAFFTLREQRSKELGKPLHLDRRAGRAMKAAVGSAASFVVAALLILIGSAIQIDFWPLVGIALFLAFGFYGLLVWLWHYENRSHFRIESM